MALKLITDELERVKREIENKAITLNIKIVTTHVDAIAEAKKAADAEAAMYEDAFQRAKDRIRRQFAIGGRGRSAGGLDVGRLNAAAGTDGLPSEDALDVLARKQVVTLAAHNRALSEQAKKIQATVNVIGAAITKYSQADDKARPGALKDLIRLRDEYTEKTKKGIAISRDEAQSLEKVLGIIARAQGKTITHFGPTVNTETAANKARTAALKLEKDRLQDAAGLYDAMASQSEKAYQAMAKAAEESGKRQVDAIKGVKDSISGLVGDMQTYFAKFGIFTSPLDAQFSKIQNLLNLGSRLKDIAVNTQNQIDAARTQGNVVVGGLRTHAVQARMSLDKYNGGDGREPAGEYKAGLAAGGGTIPAWLKAMSDKTGDTIGKQCGETITAFVRRLGLHGSATSIARSGNAVPLADGTYAPGTVFNFKGGRPGYRVNHYATVAPDGQHWLESNWHGKGQRPDMITDSRPINWRRDIAAATWGGRVNAGVPGGGARVAWNGQRVALAAGKAGGVLSQAVVDSQAGADLIKQIYEQLGNLKLTKLTALPKAWGAAVRDSEKSTFRFQAQMLLADGATQKLLRSVLGDKGFAAFAHLLRTTTNEADDFKNSIDAINAVQSKTKDLVAQRRNRGVEDDPLGQFYRSLRPGHENAVLTRTMQGTVAANKHEDQLRGDATDKAQDVIDKLRAQIRDQRSITKAGAAFVTSDSVDTYGKSRAEELKAKSVEYRNAPMMQSLYHAGIADKDVVSLKQYNQLLRDFDAAQALAYDEPKGHERAEMVARQRQELNLSTDSLRRRLAIVRNSTLNETQMNDALEREASIREKTQEFIDRGFTKQRAEELAKEAAAHEQINRQLDRTIQRTQELLQLRSATALDVAKANDQSNIISRVPALAVGSGIVNFATARSDKHAELMQQLQDGKLKFYNDVQDRMGQFDAGAVAKRNGDAVMATAQAQANLEQKRMELAGHVTELAKQQALWAAEDTASKVTGVALTDKELEARKAIAVILAGIDKTNVQLSLKDAQTQANLAGTYDPRKLRSATIFDNLKNQFGDDAAKANLPDFLKVDEITRRRQEVQQVLGGMKDDFSQAFLDIKTKGIGSFADMFTAISNRLQGFAADIIANKIWDWIGGAIGGFVGGRVGAPASTTASGANGSHAAGLERVPFDGYRAILHKNEKVLTAAEATMDRDRSRRREARDISRGAAMSQATSASSGGAGGIVIQGDIHLHDVGKNTDLPREIRNHIEKAAPSRRTASRQLARAGDLGG